MSQEELAHRAGMDRTFISRLERGIRQPSLTTLLLLSEALQTTASHLVAQVEDALTGSMLTVPAVQKSRRK